MLREETTTYLEMTSPGELRRAEEPALDFALRRSEIPCPEFNRFLYATVGEAWYWIDRLTWSREEWLAYLEGVETWVGYVAGTPAGYFELRPDEEGGVELAYFGLLPQFVGRGLGGHLLTLAIQRAWQLGPSRVWVHTSSFDHPHALRNYVARGFRVLREERAMKELPR
jgi:GNAT superfamily N-acetyltransferase